MQIGSVDNFSTPAVCKLVSVWVSIALKIRTSPRKFVEASRSQRKTNSPSKLLVATNQLK